MPLSFLRTADPAEFVGRTPWSARDALVPLYANDIRHLQRKQADEGVGRGPGGPTINADWSAMAKLSGIGLQPAFCGSGTEVPRRLKPILQAVIRRR